MAKVQPLVAADARAVCYLALGKIAPKRGDRDKLMAGTTYDVDLEISGKVGRKHVVESLAGTLIVGEDQVRNVSTACDQAELLAYAVAGLDKPARQRLFKLLREAFRDTGSIPSVDSDVLADTKALLTELRSTKVTDVRGNVTFVERKAAA
jgi:hypothetical protein